MIHFLHVLKKITHLPAMITVIENTLQVRVALKLILLPIVIDSGEDHLVLRAFVQPLDLIEYATVPFEKNRTPMTSPALTKNLSLSGTSK